MANKGEFAEFGVVMLLTGNFPFDPQLTKAEEQFTRTIAGHIVGNNTGKPKSWMFWSQGQLLHYYSQQVWMAGSPVWKGSNIDLTFFSIL